MRLKVCLNGTDVNPYARYGLTQNPFPQVAKAEIAGAVLKLQSLGGAPIPNVEYIRETLKGWSSEFIELCCAKFVLGTYVTFVVEFPD